MYDIIAFIVILVVIVLLIGVEIFLAMRKRWWWGLFPVALLTAFLLFMNINANHEMNSYRAERLKGTDGNGHRLELTIRYDSEGKVIDFSKLSVKDGAGGLLEEVPLEFNSKGQWVDSDSTNIHKKDVERLIGSRTLTGYSMDSEIMNEPMIKLSEGSYLGVDSTARAIAAQVGPLLLLYAVCRLAVRFKYRREGMRKLEIDSL